MKKVLFLTSLLTLQFDGTLAMFKKFVPRSNADNVTRVQTLQNPKESIELNGRTEQEKKTPKTPGCIVESSDPDLLPASKKLKVENAPAGLFGTGTTETGAPKEDKQKEDSFDSDSTFHQTHPHEDGDADPSSDTWSGSVDSDRADRKEVLPEEEDGGDNPHTKKSKAIDTTNGLSDDALDVFGSLWADMTKEQPDDIQCKIVAAVATNGTHSPQAFIAALYTMQKHEPLAICKHLANDTFNDNCRVLVPDLKEGKITYVQKPFKSVEDHFTSKDEGHQSNILQAVPDMIDNFYKMQPDSDTIDMSTINNIVARYLSALKIVPLLYDDDERDTIFNRAIAYAKELENANTNENQYAAMLIRAIYNCCQL